MWPLQTALLLILLQFQTVRCQECSNPDTQVLILGGGMTGLSAANRLNELGVTDFMILEGESQLGGRLKNEEAVPGVTVNVGANWIHLIDPAEPRLHPLFDLAERCGGLRGIYSDFDDIRVYSGGNDISNSNTLRYADYERAEAASLTLSENRQGRGQADITAREALRMENWTPSSDEDNLVEWYNFDFSFAAPPDVTSLFRGIGLTTEPAFLQQPDNEAGDYLITDQRGYVYLAECLAHNFSSDPTSDARILLNTRVTQVSYNDSCVCASAMRDGINVELCAPYAIVTFSIGVLQQQQQAMFSPPLTQDKRDALDLISMAHYMLIYSIFEERFWDDVENIGRVSTERGYFPLIRPLHRSHGLNATVLILTGEIADQLSNENLTTISQEITQVFRGIYGTGVPEPSRVFFENWRSNPFFLGSYSNLRPGVTDETFKELVKPEGRMYLAGEGTHSVHHGYVHGAFLSGIDTVNTILSSKGIKNVGILGTVLLWVVAAICIMC